MTMSPKAFLHGLSLETQTAETSCTRDKEPRKQLEEMDESCMDNAWVAFPAEPSFRSCVSNRCRGSSVEAARPRKSLSFAPQVRVHVVIGRWELSEEEHSATWLSSDDSKRSQENILETVRAMRSCGPEEGDEALPEGLSSRGVEHMRTRESIAHRRQIKLKVVDAVLEEQSHQKYEGVDNPIALAEASMLVSKKCRAKAAAKGSSDAACARVYARLDRMTINQKQPSMASAAAAQTYDCSTDSSNSRRAETSLLYDWCSSNRQADEPKSGELLRGFSGEGKSDGDESNEVASRLEMDTMFTNISHRKLKEKLMSRISSFSALGA